MKSSEWVALLTVLDSNYLSTERCCQVGYGVLKKRSQVWRVGWVVKRIFCCVKQISRALLFLKLTFSPSENQRLEDDPFFFWGGGGKRHIFRGCVSFSGNPTLKFGTLNVVLTSWKVYNSLDLNSWYIQYTFIKKLYDRGFDLTMHHYPHLSEWIHQIVRYWGLAQMWQTANHMSLVKQLRIVSLFILWFHVWSSFKTCSPSICNAILWPFKNIIRNYRIYFEDINTIFSQDIIWHK